MIINDSLERVLEQARELQQSIIEAFSKATDEIKPQIESSLHTARDLQETLIKHMEAEAELVCKNTTAATSHLEDYLALGAHALQESSEQMRIMAKKMIQQAAKVVDAAAATAADHPADLTRRQTVGAQPSNSRHVTPQN